MFYEFSDGSSATDSLNKADEENHKSSQVHWEKQSTVLQKPILMNGMQQLSLC